MKNLKYFKYIIYFISMNLLITSKSAAFEVGKAAFEILENGKIIHMVEDLKGRNDRNFFYKKTYSVIYKSTPFICFVTKSTTNGTEATCLSDGLN